jgi:hypothetical protein
VERQRPSTVAAYTVLGIMVVSAAIAALVSSLWSIAVMLGGTAVAALVAWAALPASKGPATDVGPELEEERRAA